MACKYTDGGAIPKCMHSDRGQLQRSSLASCIHVLQRPGLAARALPELQWARGGTQEAGISKCNYLWIKASEICRGSPADVGAVGFFSVESCWGHLWSRGDLGTVVALTA